MDWFEDEEFWRDAYPFLFPPERFAAAQEQVADILALTGLENGNVLDLCCGPGRHSEDFARRGFTVTGVDRSQFLLSKAQETGAAVEWVQEDMRRFSRPETFHLTVNLFTSFGYFDEEGDRQVLANIHRNLLPGGLLVLDVAGKEVVARRWSPCHYTAMAGNIRMVQHPEIRDDWGSVHMEWMMIRGETVRSFWIRHNLYSGRELRERLRDAGFAEVSLYGNLQGAPYDVDATRLVAVARK